MIKMARKRFVNNKIKVGVFSIYLCIENRAVQHKSNINQHAEIILGAFLTKRFMFSLHLTIPYTLEPAGLNLIGVKTAKKKS